MSRMSVLVGGLLPDVGESSKPHPASGDEAVALIEVT